MTTKELTRTTKSETRASAPPAAPAPRRMTPFDFLQTEIDRVFDSFNSIVAPPFDRAFTPDMEVTETEDAIQVTTEVPGMDEKDIEISVTDGQLTIRGEKKTEKDERKKDYRLVERSYGSFCRTVSLPAGIDATKVKASLDKGVLTVEAPKPAAAKARQVKITAK